MRGKSYTQAVRLANAAGLDAAEKRRRNAGRTAMSAEDFDHGAAEVQRILVALGFDVVSWRAMAGVPRNEPEPQPKGRRGKRKQAPVQLTFDFA